MNPLDRAILFEKGADYIQGISLSLVVVVVVEEEAKRVTQRSRSIVVEAKRVPQ